MWRHWKERAIQSVNNVLNDLRLNCLEHRTKFIRLRSAVKRMRVINLVLEPVWLSFLVRKTNKVVDGYVIMLGEDYCIRKRKLTDAFFIAPVDFTFTL